MNENLRKIIAEEVSKIIREDQDAREAQISSALSFIQDVQGSAYRLVEQQGLEGTSKEVDNHLQHAINHVNQAVARYLEGLTSLGIQHDVINRIGEISIGKEWT